MQKHKSGIWNRVAVSIWNEISLWVYLSIYLSYIILRLIFIFIISAYLCEIRGQVKSWLPDCYWNHSVLWIKSESFKRLI